MAYRRFATEKPLSKGDWVLALLSGGLLALSFPEPGWWWLAWVAFVPLFIATGKRSPRRAFLLAFAAGTAGYGGILYWINIVMTRYGGLPLAVSAVLAVLLAGYLALYLGVLFFLVRKGEERRISALVSFPVLWVALEYVRSFLLTGFPWASLAYSQYEVLPLIQIADITGIYGISFLVAFANVVLFRTIRGLAKRGVHPLPVKSWVVLALLLGSVLFYGHHMLQEEETGDPLRVALIQGNIDQGVKWDPSYRDATIAAYDRLTRKACLTGVDLVIWPESAAPFFFQDERESASRIEALARETKSCILFGSPAYETAGERTSYLNSAFLLSPTGETIGRSDKIHLVPFGEYVPLAKLLPFVNKLVVGIGDFAPGASIATLETGKGKVGVLICFEGIFPELARGYALAGSRALVNITNDAWYGRSSAPYQHLSMTVFRGIENRLPVLRAANTGISAVIDTRGRIRGETALFEEAVLGDTVRLPISPGTFYTRHGDLFAWSCLVAGILLFFLMVARRKGGKAA